MSGFHDFLIDSTIDDLCGWSRESTKLKTVVLEASNWGELKRKIGEKREEADVLVVKGDKKFNTKACEDARIDIVIISGEQRIDQAAAKAASENNVTFAFDFSTLKADRIKRMKIWKTDIQILQKYDVDYLATTNPENSSDIRAPRDIAALINELGGDGMRAVKEAPSQIMSELKQRKSSNFISKGVEEA